MVSPKIKSYVASDQRKQDVVIADGACHCGDVRSEFDVIVTELRRELLELRDELAMMREQR